MEYRRPHGDDELSRSQRQPNAEGAATPGLDCALIGGAGYGHTSSSTAVSAPARAVSVGDVLHLQRCLGNRAVARLAASQALGSLHHPATAVLQREDPPNWQAPAGPNRGKQAPPVDIAATYKSKNEAILQKIANTLASTIDVDAYLKDLNAAVQQRLSAGARDADTALDAELVKWEKDGGFTSPPTIVTRILTTDEFKKFGNIPRMFHDMGVSRLHGIETHRLQWHIVIREMLKDASLNVRPAQLYLEIQNTAGLWRDLFDRDMTLATGSSPETFMTYLRAHAKDRYPALTTIYDVKVGSQPLTDPAFLQQWWKTSGRTLATGEGEGEEARPVYPLGEKTPPLDTFPELLGSGQKEAVKKLKKELV